jgi:hypothetical protein
MGTSSAYGGPNNDTPLVPTWLEPDSLAPPIVPNRAPIGNGDQGDGPPTDLKQDPLTQLVPDASRFMAARTNFSRFARSGGRDRASLGRAVSHYVSTSSGGARQAARCMGSSRVASRRLIGFLSDAVARGTREALRALNLDGLVGRPIEEVFLGLADYVCLDGGTVDEGIARDAFIETIVDLAENGITNLDALTADQMQTVFELYATHAIEARLYNDIGTKAIFLTPDIRAAERVQRQLRDFIQRGVADALTSARNTLQELTQARISGFVDYVYEQTFVILQRLGKAVAG